MSASGGGPALLPEADAASALANLLDEPITVVDVGCRWGFADKWTRLGERCRSVGFDPDAEECARLGRMYADRPGVVLVPRALGATVGPTVLYITEDPSGNSVYPTVTDVVERHPVLAGGRVDRTTTIDMTTLDQWCEEAGLSQVDVIKIDTQGAELSVLEGAGRVLDTVRLIELEAEFNPLYEGVPLFGDIDRHLRDRGFVLWRLKDMTHYTQRDAPVDWRSEESFNFDDHISHFPAGAGQLFWANAFYVRREFAYPDASAGWQSLVRDACIAGATGFVDLVGLAVNQARKSAPDSVQPVLEAAMSADVREARRNQELATASARLTETFTLDMDDASFEGGGWRPAQRLDFGAVRWTGPAREAWIDLPFRLGPGCVVELLVLGALDQSIIDDLVVEVNREPLALDRDHTEAGVVYRGTVPAGYESDRRYTRVMLRTTDTIPWNSVHPESPDDAELGVAVSWVRLSPPPPTV